jgi:hypothetical protein
MGGREGGREGISFLFRVSSRSGRISCARGRKECILTARLRTSTCDNYTGRRSPSGRIDIGNVPRGSKDQLGFRVVDRSSLMGHGGFDEDVAASEKKIETPHLKTGRRTLYYAT